MFVSDDIIYCPRLFNPRKPRNKKSTSRNKSKRCKLILPRRNKTFPFDTVIQEITDEDGMLEDITIESASTVGSVVSGDIGAAVAAMENSGHRTNCNHMGGTYAYMHLYHNSSPYDFFNLMTSEDLRSVILKEFTNKISAMKGSRRKGDRYRKKPRLESLITGGN